MYLSNVTGIASIFLVGVALLARAVHCAGGQRGSASVNREATCAATQKVSEEGRKHWQEVRQQRVGLIQQQESDDRCSQSLGLAE